MVERRQAVGMVWILREENELRSRLANLTIRPDLTARRERVPHGSSLSAESGR